MAVYLEAAPLIYSRVNGFLKKSRSLNSIFSAKKLFCFAARISAVSSNKIRCLQPFSSSCDQMVIFRTTRTQYFIEKYLLAVWGRISRICTFKTVSGNDEKSFFNCWLTS
jgi:hypothetical protein